MCLQSKQSSRAVRMPIHSLRLDLGQNVSFLWLFAAHVSLQVSVLRCLRAMLAHLPQQMLSVEDFLTVALHSTSAFRFDRTAPTRDVVLVQVTNI